MIYKKHVKPLRQNISLKPQASSWIKVIYSAGDAYHSLDVSETALRRWVSQLSTEREGQTPKSKALTSEQKRIQRLEVRVKQLETKKKILKKATTLLMSDEFNNIR